MRFYLLISLNFQCNDSLKKNIAVHHDAVDKWLNRNITSPANALNCQAFHGKNIHLNGFEIMKENKIKQTSN